MPVRVKVSGIPELEKYLDSLPRGVKKTAGRAIASYLVGQDDFALRKEPPSNFVTRASAYGIVKPGVPAGYFSMRQFRFVAAITNGFTEFYTRTHELVNAWRYRESNSDWRRIDFYNDASGGEYVVGNKQSRHEELVGWQTAVQTIKDNLKGAIREARAAVHDALQGRKEIK